MVKKNYREKTKILFLATEAAPFAKAGGIGDIVGSLPKAIAENYHLEIRIMIPRYKFIDLDHWNAQLIAKNLKVSLPDKKFIKIDIYKVFIPNTVIPLYFLDIPKFFSGDSIYNQSFQGSYSLPFINFAQIALEVIKAMDWQPKVIHLHDWHVAIVSKWLKDVYQDSSVLKEVASVLTIHNILYQGKLDFKDSKLLGLKKSNLKIPSRFNPDGKINILAEGILNADMVNTVSPTYARELLTKKYGFGLQKLLKFRKKDFTGILNGIDYSTFDPRTNPDTPVKYWLDSLDKKVENKLFLQKKFGLTQSPDLPLICTVTRLTRQKGLDLIEDVMKDLVDMGAQFIILGSGSEKIEKVFIKAEKKYPESVEAKMEFDANLAQTIYAGADMLLMPSRFEPCGLSQIIAMRFGTIPIVRETGGLADTVRDGYTGFVFRHYDKNAFLWAIRRAVDIFYNQKDNWRKMQINAMKKDFSWKSSAKKYIWLYKRAIANLKNDIRSESGHPK